MTTAATDTTQHRGKRLQKRQARRVSDPEEEIARLQRRILDSGPNWIPFARGRTRHRFDSRYRTPTPHPKENSENSNEKDEADNESSNPDTMAQKPLERVQSKRRPSEEYHSHTRNKTPFTLLPTAPETFLITSSDEDIPLRPRYVRKEATWDVGYRSDEDGYEATDERSTPSSVYYSPHEHDGEETDETESDLETPVYEQARVVAVYQDLAVRREVVVVRPSQSLPEGLKAQIEQADGQGQSLSSTTGPRVRGPRPRPRPIYISPSASYCNGHADMLQVASRTSTDSVASFSRQVDDAFFGDGDNKEVIPGPNCSTTSLLAGGRPLDSVNSHRNFTSNNSLSPNLNGLQLRPAITAPAVPQTAHLNSNLRPNGNSPSFSLFPSPALSTPRTPIRSPANTFDPPRPPSKNANNNPALPVHPARNPNRLVGVINNHSIIPQQEPLLHQPYGGDGLLGLGLTYTSSHEDPERDHVRTNGTSTVLGFYPPPQVPPANNYSSSSSSAMGVRSASAQPWTEGCTLHRHNNRNLARQRAIHFAKSRGELAIGNGNATSSRTGRSFSEPLSGSQNGLAVPDPKHAGALGNASATSLNVLWARPSASTTSLNPSSATKRTFRRGDKKTPTDTSEASGLSAGEGGRHPSGRSPMRSPARLAVAEWVHKGKEAWEKRRSR